MEELGGALTHNKVSGVFHYLAQDEEDAFDFARVLLSYLPNSFDAPLPAYASSADNGKNRS